MHFHLGCHPFLRFVTITIGKEIVVGYSERYCSIKNDGNLSGLSQGSLLNSSLFKLPHACVGVGINIAIRA